MARGKIPVVLKPTILALEDITSKIETTIGTLNRMRRIHSRKKYIKNRKK